MSVELCGSGYAGQRSRRKKSSAHRPSSKSYDQPIYNTSYTSDVDISTTTDTTMQYVSPPVAARRTAVGKSYSLIIY